MNILEALALWRKVKPWLEKPWIKWLLGILAKLFTTNRESEAKDQQGWTKTGRDNFDSRLDPPPGGG